MIYVNSSLKKNTQKSSASCIFPSSLVKTGREGFDFIKGQMKDNGEIKAQKSNHWLKSQQVNNLSASSKWLLRLVILQPQVLVLPCSRRSGQAMKGEKKWEGLSFVMKEKQYNEERKAPVGNQGFIKLPRTTVYGRMVPTTWFDTLSRLTRNNQLF